MLANPTAGDVHAWGRPGDEPGLWRTVWAWLDAVAYAPRSTAASPTLLKPPAVASVEAFWRVSGRQFAGRVASSACAPASVAFVAGCDRWQPNGVSFNHRAGAYAT